MTELNGLRTSRNERLCNWLGQFDTENFLIARQSHSDPNLLDDDAQQGLLTIGLPTSHFGGAIAFENCLFWMPNYCPAGKSVHLASSRVGNRPDQKKAIFDALRTFAVQAASDNFFLVTHSRVSLDSYVSRLSELFDLPLVTLTPMPNEINSDWFRLQLNESCGRMCFYTALHDSVPAPDQLLFGCCTEVRILSARPGGNIAESASERLQLQNPNRSQTLVLVDSELTPLKLIRSFQEQGAIDWWLYQNAEIESDKQVIGSSIFSLSEFASQTKLDDFMIHWTRQCTGPWPDQSENDFVDALILGFNSTDHSRIAALCRIVASGRLLASNQLVRSTAAVVCFADIPVDQLKEKRIFRSHLGRWDFELCGIAIRKSILQSMGVKPVVYGGEKTWERLSVDEQPFFQIAQSISKRGQTIDWTQENEHRVCSNVVLDQIALEDAFLFVETREEAETVAPLSRWPVVVLTQ